MKIKFRAPRVSKKIGGVRVNLSKRGPSFGLGGKGVSFNSRTGCLISPLTILFNLFKKR